ncbi:HAMP domain-containing histidine kinase [Hwanghaeella grinnelliae]|uniref:histidine kinase n=1 Tax=Hwanghaeella grinnelliae TaxID=2500179 RepID=A0A3S2ZBV3_9PROT|nr:HAMP domain-containing sensor histidine kinase [Hwanghaeella grinnelliae]RVU38993.1 HAMP domain-containing histidine kinase [Hwanghaeella grinnelliae]
MRKDKLTVVAVAVVSFFVFVFLGAVSLESATSLSIINQQRILRALLAVPGSAEMTPEDILASLSDRAFMESGTFFAFGLDGEGKATILGPDRATPGRAALVAHIQNNRNLEPQQMFFDADGSIFVWIDASMPGHGGELFLAFQRPDDTWLTRARLYFVPSVIAILVVLWISVWSGLIARRSTRAHNRQQELELELRHQEEASRVKSAFLANMNHELRTPLNAILGFSQMMQMQIFGPIGHEKYKEYVENIIFASTHLRKLIGNILDISKIEAGEDSLDEEIVCFKDVVAECYAMTQKDFESKKQRVVLNQEENACCILADRLKIRQILLNLLTNANKFTPDGGTVTVSVGAGRKGAGGLYVTVADTGKGIAAEELETILKPFKRSQDQADTAKDGFGLGLPLSCALAKMHGATFDMESEVGAGTTVRIVFPEERVIPHNDMQDTESAA